MKLGGGRGYGVILYYFDRFISFDQRWTGLWGVGWMGLVYWFWAFLGLITWTQWFIKWTKAYSISSFCYLKYIRTIYEKSETARANSVIIPKYLKGLKLPFLKSLRVVFGISQNVSFKDHKCQLLKLERLEMTISWNFIPGSNLINLISLRNSNA